jgi:hypothetical protein
VATVVVWAMVIAISMTLPSAYLRGPTAGIGCTALIAVQWMWVIQYTGTAGHFASYAGAAPVEVSSGDTRRHRLSRAGDRQLNAALHMIAIVQIRITDSDGHAYFHRKLTEG